MTNLEALNAFALDYLSGKYGITAEDYLAGYTELTGTAEEASMREPVWTCTTCGMVGEWDDGMVENEKHEIDGNCFCSEECAEQYGYHRCEECGDWCEGDEVVEHDGKHYCTWDCAHDAELERCQHCGEWFDRYDGEVFEYQFGWRRLWGDGVFCSESCCIDAGFIRCDHCEEWMPGNDATWVSPDDGDEERWCQECADDTFTCEGCGERRPDDMYHGDGYCELCNHGEHLHEYGWRPSLSFFGGDEYQRDTPFLGIELETDSGDDRRDYVEELHNIVADGKDFESRFWMTEDSSLTNGVEITGHPMTLAEHVEICGIYESIRDTARRFDYVSHDSGNCGLHIHVNRNFFGRTKEARDAGGYKMLRALQRFEHQFTVFSRRDNNYWCEYRTREDYTPGKKNGKVLYDMRDFRYKSASAARCRTHEQCLNFQHLSTFEFRIFRGTLKLETLYASMALVNGLCHVAKKRGSMFFETCDWYTLIGEIVENVDTEYAKDCLVAYLEERGLN